MAGVNDFENLKIVLKESFSKIKDDFNSLSDEVKVIKENNNSKKIEKELSKVKESNERLAKENELLKKRFLSLENNKNKEVNYETIIDKAVEKAVKKINGNGNKLKDEFVRKFERKRKDLIKQKIIELVKAQELTIPEIKEVVVDKECYCSKATFYRYIERLQNTKELDFIEINERK